MSRMMVTASILDCDLSRVAAEAARALRGGADRLHLDVMDGHFVPNITFGPTLIKRLRTVGRQPFDAHLMISEPGRYLDQFLDAGCDSITFHVEVEEPIEPILRRIREAGRQAGLAIRPATSLTALEPYRDLLDIVMVMTVEPGFGGQEFRVDAAQKILPAHDYLADRASGQVHVDGGVNRGSAELCGALGAEVVVAGSILWKSGVDIAHEIRLLKALADKGYSLGAGMGASAVPHGEWVRFATLPTAAARRLAARVEAAGIPVVTLPAERVAGSAGRVPMTELMVPARLEKTVVVRFGEELENAVGGPGGAGAPAAVRGEKAR